MDWKITSYFEILVIFRDLNEFLNFILLEKKKSKKVLLKDIDITSHIGSKLSTSLLDEISILAQSLGYLSSPLY